MLSVPRQECILSVRVGAGIIYVFVWRTLSAWLIRSDCVTIIRGLFRPEVIQRTTPPPHPTVSRVTTSVTARRLVIGVLQSYG
jgi:hypothetical protein